MWDTDLEEPTPIGRAMLANYDPTIADCLGTNSTFDMSE